MRDDGQPVDPTPFRIPVSRYEAQWRQQNERLKRDVERQRARIQELRREKETLQELAEDPATEPLKKENARLEKLLRQSQDEAERLNQEIQRLKQALEKHAREHEKK
jgi:prefoldin subunit 5